MKYVPSDFSCGFHQRNFRNKKNLETHNRKFHSCQSCGEQLVMPSQMHTFEDCKQYQIEQTRIFTEVLHEGIARVRQK